jgi:dCTP deaminase
MGATLSDKIEGALASQEMRQAFFTDKWTDLKYSEEEEKRIQPGSYEPVNEGECWRVPDGFVPPPGVTVLEALKQLLPRDRQHYAMSETEGVTTYVGYSYLFPLQGNWNIPDNFFMRSSPKSTEGRMFNFVRLVADGISRYDDVRGPFKGKMYAMVRPLVFNNVIFPGFSQTQLRMYCRRQCVLPDSDLLRLINQHNLVKHDGKPIPVDELQFDNGLLLTADLKGEQSEGLVGFKALKNPDPVDRRKFREYDWQLYFDPVFAPKEGYLQQRKGEFYLTQSWEWVEMTDTQAGVMMDYRTNLMESRGHLAGYFDPKKFMGIATLETPVVEDMNIPHRRPTCAINYEEMRIMPDKRYEGKHLGQTFALVPKPMTLPTQEQIKQLREARG